MARRPSKKRPAWRRYILYSIILIGVANTTFYFWRYRRYYFSPPIPIGILHSRSSGISDEQFLVDIAKAAIKKINISGGVLGYKLKPVIAWGDFDEQEFAHQAERLIAQEQVPVIFGCWTSASRKAVKPVVEQYNNLLMYSVQYEGIEESPNIFYLGATPNQQIIPTISWAMKWFGPKFFLIGSDYIYPHVAHAIMKDAIQARGGSVVGEAYISFLDDTKAKQQIQDAVARIQTTQPNMILNTINGRSDNTYFFNTLTKAGISADQIPTISYSITEKGGAREGDYVAWSYFNTINSSDNENFKKKLNQILESLTPQTRRMLPVTDPEETTYVGIHLWARAVEAAGTPAPDQVKKQLINTSYPAPEGIVHLSPYHHMWRPMRIGKITSCQDYIEEEHVSQPSQFTIVWSSEKSIEPQIYPLSRSPQSWKTFVNNLYHEWGNKWTRS